MFHVFEEVAEGIAKMATTQNEKVRVLQRKLYIASKQQEDYRFYSLYDKVYRWARRLSQRSSKCLTPDTWKILRQKGLEFFVVTKARVAKGVV